MANLMWRLLMLSLDSCNDFDQPLFRSRIIAVGDVHLQYMRELEAEPSSISGTSGEALGAMLAYVPPLLCRAVHNCGIDPVSGLYDAGLVFFPGILNAAMLELAGLGKYLHALHAAKQSCDERPNQGADNGASSSHRSSSTSSMGTSGRRPSKVIGANGFVQLQLAADHEGVGVVGGGRAVAALDKRLVSFGQRSTVGSIHWKRTIVYDYSRGYNLLNGAVQGRLMEVDSKQDSVVNAAGETVHAGGNMLHSGKTRGHCSRGTISDGGCRGEPG